MIERFEARTLSPMSATSPFPAELTPDLRPVRLGIDTHQEPVIYMRADCPVCRSEGFEAHSRVLVSIGERHLIATLNVVRSEQLLAVDAVGLSEAAWQRLDPAPGERARFAHPPPVESLSDVRRKIYGHELGDEQLNAIVHDIVRRRYTDVELAAFVTACSGDRMSVAEVTGLTRAMIDVGERLSWDASPVVDKHCVGGLPGNRTTPLVVSIVAALGLTMPKTSSRAITSPAGTADTMETMAPVNLSLAQMRQVVEREGGCIAWGGAVHLSPGDDILVRIQRALNLDSEDQLVASVLSKKTAAGSTHVVIDVPVGPTAKLRSPERAQRLQSRLLAVGERLGLTLRVIQTDGRQPIGRGIGPALEAHDVLAVLQGSLDAPQDLRARALLLAGEVLELAGRAPAGGGAALAAQVLDDGRAWAKFQAICEAQGGMREPGVAPLQQPVLATASGCLLAIDNRRLAQLAKLAGAPAAPTAGVQMHVRLGDQVSRGQPLLTLHTETPGEMAYALEYVQRHNGLFLIGDPA